MKINPLLLQLSDHLVHIHQYHKLPQQLFSSKQRLKIDLDIQTSKIIQNSYKICERLVQTDFFIDRVDQLISMFTDFKARILQLNHSKNKLLPQFVAIDIDKVLYIAIFQNTPYSELLNPKTITYNGKNYIDDIFHQAIKVSNLTKPMLTCFQEIVFTGVGFGGSIAQYCSDFYNAKCVAFGPVPAFNKEVNKNIISVIIDDDQTVRLSKLGFEVLSKRMLEIQKSKNDNPIEPELKLHYTEDIHKTINMNPKDQFFIGGQILLFQEDGIYEVNQIGFCEVLLRTQENDSFDRYKVVSLL